MKTENLFDLKHTLAQEFLMKYEYPWQALPYLKEFIVNLGKTLDKGNYNEVKENVWIHKTAEISESAHIDAPCIIGEETQVRQCAFIRGSALIGNNCVVGNSTEVKNSIVFDNVQIPHYNYVGDSVLGYKSHLGAGAITSNVKSDKTQVTIKYDNKKIETGLKKFGAMVGDFVEVGCNSVLCPGTVVGRKTIIYPLSRIRGYVPEQSIYKDGDNIIKMI